MRVLAIFLALNCLLGCAPEPRTRTNLLTPAGFTQETGECRPPPQDPSGDWVLLEAHHRTFRQHGLRAGVRINPEIIPGRCIQDLLTIRPPNNEALKARNMNSPLPVVLISNHYISRKNLPDRGWHQALTQTSVAVYRHFERDGKRSQTFSTTEMRGYWSANGKYNQRIFIIDEIGGWKEVKVAEIKAGDQVGLIISFENPKNRIAYFATVRPFTGDPRKVATDLLTWLQPAGHL